MKRFVLLLISVFFLSTTSLAEDDRYSMNGFDFTMPTQWAFDYDGTDDNSISFQLQNGYFQVQHLSLNIKKVGYLYLSEFISSLKDEFKCVKITEQHSFNLHNHQAEYRKFASSDDLIYEVAAIAGKECIYCSILAYSPEKEKDFSDFFDRVLLSVTIDDDENKTNSFSDSAASEDTETENTDNETEKRQPDLTAGQRNALDSANTYLKYTAFSRSGLIEQLKFEGYSESDATFAVDHCGADWNEQAYKSAKSYLAYSSFSLSGLIEQLEFEGFSSSEAKYGAEKAYNE